MSNKNENWYIQEDEIGLWEKIIPNCEIVFDVGCQNDNIFYEINPKLLEIHLFDPFLSEPLLEEIKNKNNISFNNFALGNTIEEKDFYYYYGSFMYRPEEPKFTGKFQTKKSNIKKLIDYVKEKNITYIDYLKIDTEGFDFEVIKGCGDFINNIKYIQFEDFVNFYNGIVTKDLFDYFKDWNIYYIGGRPINYLVTKENLDFLKKIN
jgi:FkbM family methyltransferase